MRSKGFGVDVVLIEPGLIVTNFGDTAADSIGNGSGEADGSAYGKFNKAVGAATAGIYEGPAAKLGGPEAVAKVIDKAISSKRPRPATPSRPRPSC